MTGGGSHRGPYGDDAQNPGDAPNSGESGWTGAYGRPGQESGAPGYSPGPSTGPIPTYGSPQYGSPQYGSPHYGSSGSAPWERTSTYGDSSGSNPESQSQTPGFGEGGTAPTQSFGAGTHGGGEPYGAYGAGPGPIGPSGPPPGTGFGDPQPLPEPQGPKKKSRGGLIAALVAGALVIGLVAGGVGGFVGSQLNDDDSTSTAANNQPLGGDPSARDSGSVPAPEGSVQQVAAQTLPSVVSIDVTTGTEQGEGSGVVLSADGVIMTNNHVVSGSNGRPATDVVVNFQDGSRSAARVLGADPISDIAVIKVDKSGLTPIKVGTSDNLAVGQDVIAIGAPLGLQGTVTTGIISALNRPVSTQREGDTTSVIDAIQTDAAINPGNSGGALVNARGALIGVNTAIATLGGGSGGEEQQSGSIGLGFAIPIDQAIRVANELRDTGKATHAGLGVSVRPSTDPNSPGALIADVQAGGPAAAAGIPKGAIVTKIDDRNIATGDALVAAVRSHNPGDRVQVTYTAGGQTKTVTVQLATLQSN
ncbi:trypsin-like peptidase domain-containing protein [uncultured Gordonia sp.]|uniref:trypsin-like peptidase domain-containing protein n=1 Tax=uncultured Gordonia sp. TaxID=198437 RepID=UPI002582627A|nr:trypsin-like peptidase domain-containing protein [uncultured Gordonia sp.]